MPSPGRRSRTCRRAGSWRVAFEQAQGEEGFLTETADDGFFVLRVDAGDGAAAEGAGRGPRGHGRRKLGGPGSAARPRKSGRNALAQAVRDGGRHGGGRPGGGRRKRRSAIAFSRRDGELSADRCRPGLVATTCCGLRPGGGRVVGEGPGGFVVAQLKEVRPASDRRGDRASHTGGRHRTASAWRRRTEVHFNGGLRRQGAGCSRRRRRHDLSNYDHLGAMRALAPQGTTVAPFFLPAAYAKARPRSSDLPLVAECTARYIR